MSNELITPSAVANESLMQLEAALTMGGIVHRGFAKEFHKVGDTVTIRRPTTFTTEEVKSGMSTQGIAESSVDVVVNQHQGVLVAITQEDMTLKLTDFSEQVITPAAQAVAQKIDADLLKLALDIPYIRAQSSTAVLKDLALLGADLDKRKVPVDNRRLVLDPLTAAEYVSLDAIANAAARGNTNAVQDRRLGMVMGFDTVMSQNVQTEGTLVGSLTGCSTPATVALGATDMTVTDADATTGLLPRGLPFKINGDSQVYTLTADATQTATGCKIYFAPGLKVAVATAKAITSETTNGSGKTCSLALHKNAIALVTVPLAPSMAVPSKVVDYKGLSVSVTFERDTTNHIDTVLVDVLYGVKVLDVNLAERFCAA